ncbi:MAG: uracil phosphoribosyltransferase [Cytophagaceae bacterium]
MFVLNQVNSVANHFLKELRSVEIQNDSMRFRKNMERLGEILAYEMSKTFQFKTEKISTPLSITEIQCINHPIVVATILRAGLPFFDGFLNFFDKAEAAFIAAYRGSEKPGSSFEINMDYCACPSLDGKILILADPMLATGKSAVKVIKELSKYGNPVSVHLASVIASPEGVKLVQEQTENVNIWTAALDEKLNEKSYIVPGLGDAGDLSFGIRK